MDSQIEIAIPGSNLNPDCSFCHELNLSSIEPPSIRMQTTPDVFEIWDQNLYGSESNMDHSYKRVNVRLVVQSRVVGIQDQNLHDSESNFDHIYEGGNLRPIVMRVVKIQDQNLYGSKSNIDHI